MDVYNLEFPSYVNELRIGNYLFERVPNYQEAFSKLEHRFRQDGGEFPIRHITGTHQITAHVNPVNSSTESKASLPWAPGYTQLEDILLILQLFTGRDVFVLNRGEAEDAVITRDPRASWYGGSLHCAIEYDQRSVCDAEGRVNYSYDAGFEQTMNKVLHLISSKQWQDMYGGGQFLFIYKAAMRPQIIEAMFILCWAVWNQIYSMRNKSTLTDAELRSSSEKAKIAYILKEYFFADNLDQPALDEIEKLCQCRHRVVHIGMKTDNVDSKELEIFIRLTEFLIAKVFGLQPSNLFNTWEKLAALLRKIRPLE